MSQENINPKHYRCGKIQVIKIIEDQLSSEEFKGFCKGLIIKYICRADHKNGTEDYEKAEWYLKYLIKKLEEIEDADSEHISNS